MSETGFETLHDNMYFTCSSGLTPAKIQPTQTVVKTEKGYNYLVKDDTGCPAVGDFMCRWTLVLAAAVAAAGVVTGGAALALLAVAAVAVSAALCGGLMAPMRVWIGYATNNAYGRPNAYSLTSKCQMTCPIGGIITYAPGITSQWQAIVYTARNTTWALVEGAIVGKFLGFGASAFAGTATVSTGTAVTNFLFLQAGARTIGVADQVVFEGMLRNGKDLSDTGEEAIAGATMFEQPFIQIWDKATGNSDQPLGWQDFYYAGVSLIAYRAMTESARTNPNIPVAAARAVRTKAGQLGRAIKGKLFERGASEALLEASREAVVDAWSQKPKPKVAGAMELEGNTVKGSSNKSILNNAFMEKILESIKTNRGRGHGHCAEIKILNKKTNQIAQELGIPIEQLTIEQVRNHTEGGGSIMREVRSEGNPRAMNLKEACGTCSQVLEQLGIKDFGVENIRPNISSDPINVTPLPIDDNDLD